MWEAGGVSTMPERDSGGRTRRALCVPPKNLCRDNGRRNGGKKKKKMP